MTPAAKLAAAKLIASCDGDAATAQAIVLDELLAALAPFATVQDLQVAERNLLARIEPNTVEAVEYLLEMRERTKRQMKGVVFS